MAESGPPSISGLSISTPTNQLQYQWNDRDIKLLNDHHKYHGEMQQAIQQIARYGPHNVVIPKKPRGSINSLVEEPKSPNVLSGIELHEYLVSRLLRDVKIFCPELRQIFPDLESITPYLCAGYAELGVTNSASLTCHLKLGLYLRQGYELFKQRKYAIHTIETWAQWLEKNVQISDTFGRQLREISSKFGDYKKFYSLGLSFNEVYKRRHEIENMLLLNREIQTFWLVN